MSNELPDNGMISKILFLTGWALNFTGWISEADLVLSFVLKITSLISFVIFLILNIPKVKSVLKKEDIERD